MEFSNSTVLNSSTEYFYFGENAYNYRSQQNLQVEGYLIDSTILSGDSSSINSEIDSFLATNTIEQITINGTDFGSGKLLQVNFVNEDESPNTKKINANLEIYKTGTLVGFPVSLGSPELIESLTENFSFTENTNTKTYNHSVDVSYIDTENNDPVALSHALSSNLFDEALASSLIDGYDSDGFKTYSTERIDLISKSYSASKQYDIVTLDGSNNYDYDLQVTARTDSNGITTITENALVRGVNGNLFDNAKNGANDLINTSYTRNQAFFGDFTNSQGYSLFDKKISLNRQLNINDGSVNYEILYSNDPAIQSNYEWRYTQEIGKSQGIYTLSEAGEIIGDGPIFPRDGGSSIERAQDAWATIEGGIESRINTFYIENTNDFRPLRLINEDVRYSEIEGLVSYSFEYSSENKDEFNGITSRVSVNESLPVDLKNNFIILKDREIFQKVNLASIGETNLSMEILGNKSSELQDYKNFINSTISKYQPEESSIRELIYLESPRLSFSPISNAATFNVSWRWHRRIDFIDEF